MLKLIYICAFFRYLQFTVYSEVLIKKNKTIILKYIILAGLIFLFIYFVSFFVFFAQNGMTIRKANFLHLC